MRSIPRLKEALAKKGLTNLKEGNIEFAKKWLQAREKAKNQRESQQKYQENKEKEKQNTNDYIKSLEQIIKMLNKSKQDVDTGDSDA